MYRPTLVLQPCHNSYAEILHAFRDRKPLRPEQLNFLIWHARQLSDAHFDPVLNYYKVVPHSPHFQPCFHSFLMADELSSAESYYRFKDKLELLLHEQQHGIITQFTVQQFENFIGHAHIIQFSYFDGNRIVVDSPLFRGKKAHVNFFQWGNFIGIVKFEIVKDAPLSETNMIVYFEEKGNKALEEFIYDFYYKYNAQIELLAQQQFELQNQIHKWQLQNELTQKEIFERELENQRLLENQLLHNHRMQNEFTQNENLRLSDELRLKNQLQEEILEEKLEEELIKEKQEEKELIESEKLELIIPDIHKELAYRPSLIFPPRFTLTPDSKIKK